jgi:hypothetical protein
MPTVNKAGDKTASPSWKVLVMTALTVLVPIGLNHFTDLNDGEIAAISGFLTFVGGYFTTPRGVT